MKRFHAGHGLATGIGVGLLLSYRPWLIFAAGVIVGICTVTLWRFGRKVGHSVARNLAHYTRERYKREIRTALKARRETRYPQSSEVPF